MNAWRLTGQRLGIGRYIEYLLKNWNRMLLPPDNVILYVPKHLSENDLKLSEVFRMKVLPPRLSAVLWENLLLPRHANELDVLFCPSYTMPLAYRGRCVVATHSINEVERGTHSRWYNLTRSLINRMSAQKADKVIVPSQSVKQDIQEHYGISANKIEIVPEGVDDSFEPIKDEELLRSTRERYLGADKPYILFVGKPSQRRNIPLLIKAFADLKKRENIPHSLLLLGPNHRDHSYEQMTRELSISDSVVQTNPRFTDHRDIVATYSAADLYVFPSAYEGFSLTTVEAMACGVPVVTTKRGALAEIAGGAALIVDDLTVEALSDAMARVLSDRELQEDLRVKSLERARSFRWKDTARRTLEVIQQVAQE
jgi:glycosyltransferase involved in cell wall biosynthesis